MKTTSQRLKALTTHALIASTCLSLFSACTPPPKVIKSEADIIILDPTSDPKVWQDARSRIIRRILNPWGVVSGDGFTGGSGTIADLNVIPIGSFTTISNAITLTDESLITAFSNKVTDSQSGPRLKAVFNQILDGSSPTSLWARVVKARLDSPAAVQMDCKSGVLDELAIHENDYQPALDDLRPHLSTDAMAEGMCSVIVPIETSLARLDHDMTTPKATCLQSESRGTNGCSDLIGAMRAIQTLLADKVKRDNQETSNPKFKYNACIFFASDMMHYDMRGPMKLPTSENSENLDPAVIGSQDSQTVVRDGFPDFSREVHAYIPYAGLSTPKHPRPQSEVSYLQDYWRSFLSTAHANVLGGTDSACTGIEKATDE